MQNSTLVCGNCGQDVASSDVTCPHCGVLLAAYASPVGSTTAHMYESSEPIADAVPEAEMYVPDPAPPIVIPDEVEVASTAPRPLFDTQLTIEEISRAAEGDHEESLVVVSEKKISAKPKVFDTPDYAKPPSDAAPVEILDGGDEGLIARTTETHSETSKSTRPEPRKPASPGENEETTSADADSRSAGRPKPPTYSQPPTPRSQAEAEPEPAGRKESWLYDLSQSGPTPLPQREPRAPREPGRRPEPTRTTTTGPGRKRGTTENYLRKLHAEADYDSDAAQLSAPVEMRTSGTTQAAMDGRRGCLGTLYLTSGIIWLITLGTLLGGNPSTFFIFLSVALLIVVQQKKKILEFVDRQ